MSKIEIESLYVDMDDATKYLTERTGCSTEQVELFFDGVDEYLYHIDLLREYVSRAAEYPRKAKNSLIFTKILDDKGELLNPNDQIKDEETLPTEEVTKEVIHIKIAFDEKEYKNYITTHKGLRRALVDRLDKCWCDYLIQEGWTLDLKIKKE